MNVLPAPFGVLEAQMRLWQNWQTASMQQSLHAHSFAQNAKKISQLCELQQWNQGGQVSGTFGNHQDPASKKELNKLVANEFFPQQLMQSGHYGLV